MQEQSCPKIKKTKYSTCLKGISHKSLLHSWRAKHLFHILKTGRRPEHSNNLYTTRVLNIPQNPCFSKYMKFQQPRIKSRSLPLFFHCEKNSQLHFNTEKSSKISKSLLSMLNRYLLSKKDERSRRIGIVLKANTHPPLPEVKQKAPELTRLLYALCPAHTCHAVPAHKTCQTWTFQRLKRFEH